MPRVPYDLGARKPYLVQTFTDREYDRRIGATREALAREGLDALIVYGSGTSPSGVTYLTNYVPVYGNVFAVLMDAVRCCSLGQITDALFEVGGRYRRNV